MSGYMECHENIVQSVDVSSSNRWPTDDSDHSLLDMDSPAIRNSNLSIPHTYETRKKFPLGDEDIKTDSTAWTHKPIWQWNKEDTIHWLISAASDLGQSYGSIRTSLTLPGEQLITLTRKQFISLDPEYGEKLYNLLQLQHNSHSLSYSDTISSPSDDELLHLHSSISDVESDNSIEVSSKRPPGRPRLLKPKKSPNKSQGKLWEFIRDLLLNRETCPSLICWEDYSQAKFRFVKSDEVAKLWGARKGNKKMSYEKLSRAMRYYYKSKIFLPVLGKRLVYQFGPNAKGWQTDNPNFLP